jgi:transketolase N-terminal domain/subunit
VSGRQWHEAYNFVNDAGHTENGIYALRANYGFDGMTFEDLKAFRSIKSKLTGHGESHLNPQGGAAQQRAARLGAAAGARAWRLPIKRRSAIG